MAEALAAAVAGRGDPVALGAEVVVEVGDQLAVLDHQRFLRRLPLVVDRVGAPLVGQAAVVVGVQQRLGNLLAELADVDAGALVDVIDLKTVAGHLVEEDAAEATTDHHRHRAGGRRAPAEQRQCLLGGLLGDQPRVFFEQLEAAVGAERLGAGLDLVVAAGDDLGADPRAGAVVAGEEAVGVGDRDDPTGLGVGGGELGDLVANRAAALVELAEELRLAGGGDVLGGDRDRHRGDRAGGQRAGLGAAGAEGRGGLVGGALELGRLEAVDVGEVGGDALDDADPGALLGARLDRLDARLVDRHRQPAAAFGEDLGEATAVGESAGEDALGDPLVEQFGHRKSSRFAPGAKNQRCTLGRSALMGGVPFRSGR